MEGYIVACGHEALSLAPFYNGPQHGILQPYRQRGAAYLKFGSASPPRKGPLHGSLPSHVALQSVILCCSEVQRLFSMFPGGSAGIALLILRFCAGGSLLMCALDHGQFPSAGRTTLGIGVILLLIGVGILTPIACTIAASIEAFYALRSHGINEWHAVFTLLVTIALGMLGPGAFSIDARLFGRRLIVPGQE